MRTFRLDRSMQVAASLVLAGACYSGTAAAQTIYSFARTYGSEAVPPIVGVESSAPGEVVSQSASQDGYYYDPDKTYFGTVTGQASAATHYGINRTSAGAGLIGISEPGRFGVAYVNADAQSSWADVWTITGGNTGDPITLSLSGRTTYDLSLLGGAQPDAPALQLYLGVQIYGTHGTDQRSFDNSVFVAHQADGYFDWSLSLIALSGEIVGVGASMQAGLSPSFAGVDLGTTRKLFSFDAMHTSKLEFVTLTDGYSIGAASGELVAHDGGFAYRAVLVPEPGTYALTAAGLLALFVTIRRRKSHGA